MSLLHEADYLPQTVNNVSRTCDNAKQATSEDDDDDQLLTDSLQPARDQAYVRLEADEEVRRQVDYARRCRCRQTAA